MDDVHAHLDKFVEMGLVTLIDWPYGYDHVFEWNTIQCNAYKHCVGHYGHESSWMAFLDTDEFLFCPDFTPLPVKLHDYLAYGAVSACWVMYGTSNVNVPAGEKITDYLVWRAKGVNTHVKTIAQPKHIQDIINPHFVVLYSGLKQVTEKEEEIYGCSSSSPSVDILRINHYWSRDLDFFYKVKLLRRDKWYHDMQTYLLIEKLLNMVYDPILKSDMSLLLAE